MKEKTAIQCLESTNLLTVKSSQLHMLHIFAGVQWSGEGNVFSGVCLSMLVGVPLHRTLAPLSVQSPAPPPEMFKLIQVGPHRIGTPGYVHNL